MNNNEFNILLKNDLNDLNNKNMSKFLENKNEQELLKEDRISYKLTLRKQKLQEKLYNKRIFQSPDIFNFFIIGNECIKRRNYTEEDLLKGKIYEDLKNAYKSNNKTEIKECFLGLGIILENKYANNKEILNFLKNSDSKEDGNFALGNLSYEIMLHIDDILVYIYSINILLNFSFISNDFCTLITSENKIKEILNRLNYFYPLYIEEKKNNENNSNNNTSITLQENSKILSYYVMSQTLKLLGNLFINAKSYKEFELNNFYNKIFFLLSIFNLNFKNKKYIIHVYEYLRTLLWLVCLFFEKIEDIKIKYFDKIIKIIPNLLNSIRGLYFTQETELLEYIIYIIEEIENSSMIFSKEIVENDGIKILSNLFGYLFNTDKNGFEIEINSEITLRILGIFINIFLLESEYIINYDLSQFTLVYEKLFDIYKMHHSNHYDIQDALLQLLANLGCFDDIEDIVINFFLNNKIMNNLFIYYYKYHKSRTLIIIDNIIQKQHKKVRDFILDKGGFNAIKNSIIDYDNELSENLLKEGLAALYNLINVEKKFNIRLLFEKIYKTSIPEKIREIELNLNLPIDIDAKTKSMIIEFDAYEKSLEDEL